MTKFTYKMNMRIWRKRYIRHNKARNLRMWYKKGYQKPKRTIRGRTIKGFGSKGFKRAIESRIKNRLSKRQNRSKVTTKSS